MQKWFKVLLLCSSVLAIVLLIVYALGFAWLMLLILNARAQAGW